MTFRPLIPLAILLAALAAPAPGQTVNVPNASFEEGTDGPASWTLSGGQGKWLDADAADGRRAIVVTGAGKDSNSWRSDALPIEPDAVYRLRFRARSLGASGGTPITGPAFCNRDLGAIPGEWTACDSIFATPTPGALKPEDAYLRFGQWEVNGTVAFDAIELARAMPVFARAGDLALGEGESLDGNRYTFVAPLNGNSRNHSRPLHAYSCTFNSDRWCLGAGHEIVYRHHVAGHKAAAAEIEVSTCWYSSGELLVEASADGKAWQALGSIGQVAGAKLAVPADLLPAETVWVRLRARPKEVDGKPEGGASLQVGFYAFRATLDGPPVTLVGHTRFLAVTRADPRLKVEIDSIGEGVPGGDNRVPARSITTTATPLAVLPTGAVDGRPPPDSHFMSLEPGENRLDMLYAVPGPGTHTLAITYAAPEPPVGGFAAEASFHVAELHDTSYGQRLPASTDAVGLWWAPSGWKVSRSRPAPTDKGEAVLLRAARNEAEAAQIVLRPAAALKGLTAKAGALAGPGGAAIPPENVEVLRVRYLNITQPTDATGTAAPWPDPLPPLKEPLDLEAGRNQPLWIRVKVPADAKPGAYTGKIVLAAEGWKAEAPLKVEVYGFALPDRMTCRTSFGFSPGEVWRYHGLKKEEDRRTVLEKYLACLSAHHVSPYDPAPLDPFKVTWPDKKNPKPEFDWSAWDAAMTRAIDRHHFNAFAIPVVGMGGGTFHSRVDPELLGYKEDAPEYKAAFTAYGRAVQQHLREKGWLPYAYVYWFDEPDPKDYAFVMNGFRKLKEAAPDLTRMLTEQVEPDLVGGPNLWCPITPEYRHDRAEERRKAGDRFWWYVCCGPKAPYCTLFIDHPATELRVWLWQTWQRRIDGILVWSVNYWTSGTAYTDPKRPQNPYDDPASWVDGYGTAKGAKVLWGNGDGRFLYPPEAAADANPPAPVLDGPVESIRLEMLRDGIEDYEYLAILRGLLAKRGKDLPEAERKRLQALLEVPPDITADMTTFTKDPAPIEARRHAVARAIEALAAR